MGSFTNPRLLDVTALRCSRCRRLLPQSSFRTSPLKKNGLQSQCKECQHAGVRIHRGMAPQDADLRPEGDRCAICGGPPGAKGLFLDHDHQTGRARGWLCGACNSLIGMARDNADTLRRAIDYLRDVEDP